MSTSKKKRDAVPLEQHVFKFRQYIHDKEKNRMVTPSRVNPNTPVKDVQEYQQAFSLPDNSFEYIDNLSPCQTYSLSFNELLLAQYNANLHTNPTLPAGVPDPAVQLNPELAAYPNLPESFETMLNDLVIPENPILGNMPQNTENNTEPHTEDLSKCMEQLTVDESNEKNPSSTDSDGIPRRLPSRPNPPPLQASHKLRYLRASDEFKRYFNNIDRNNDGKISFDELKACLKNRDVSSYQDFSDETIRMLIQTFDDDNDQQINIKEFPELAAFLGNWGRCFTFLDEDNSGTIDYQEMHHAMEVLGFRLNATFMKELIQKYNRNGSVVIDFDNFILACVTLCRFKESYQFMVKNCGEACSHISLESFLKSTVLS